METYQNGERIASHTLFDPYVKNAYSTDPAHMPPEFLKPDWNDVRIKSWAGAIGENTLAVIERIFDGVKIKEQAYNPALSVGCMLAKQCCKNRISARYIRLPDLLMERDEKSLVERSDMKLLRKYSRICVLVVDEWLINDLESEDIRFIFELVERRYSVHSTILCTQYPPDQWHARLGGGVQADAILDRLIQGSIRINLGTVNMRKLLSGA